MLIKRIFGTNGFISIDLDTLSEENKELLKRMYPEQFQKALKEATDNECSLSLKVPIREESTVGQISDAFFDMVRDLKAQDVLYGKRSLELLAKRLMPVYADEGDTIDDMITWIKEPSTIKYLKSAGELNDLNYIDIETDTIWETKELYDKHMQYIRRKQEGQTLLEQKEEELFALEIESRRISEAEALIDQQKEGQNIGED